MSGVCSAHQGPCPDECGVQYRVLRMAAQKAVDKITPKDVRNIKHEGFIALLELSAVLRTTSAPPVKP